MTDVLRKRIAQASALLLLCGGALLVEHEASEHGGGDAACMVCLAGSAEGTAGAPATPQALAARAIARPSPLVVAHRGGRPLPPAIRAPPVSPAT